MVRIGNWKSLNDDAMAKGNQSHKQKIQRPHQLPLLAPHGAAGGIGVAVGQAQRGKTRTARFGGVSD